MGITDRKRLRPATFSDSDDDKSCGFFDKFFVIQSSEQGKTYQNTSPFLIEKTVFSIIGKTNNIKKLRDGKLLVEILREKQGKNLLQLESFCDIQCTVSPHKTLNTSKGIIRDRRLFCCSEDEIKENLASEGVTHVRRIKIWKNNNLVNTNTLILTFKNPVRPEKLHILKEIITVTPYIPNPLRCFQCQKFGHHENNCKNTPVCVNCAGVGNHHEDSCDKPVKCANCQGDHPANSNKCPDWITEKDVTKVKFTNNITYPEARKIVKNKPTQFTTIVQSSMKSTRSVGVQTVEVGTQTTELPIPATSAPLAEKPSALADTLSAPADKLLTDKASASSEERTAPAAVKPSVAGKKSASADKLSATTAAKANSGIPKPGSKPVPGRSKAKPSKADAKTGSARSPNRKGPTQDPIKTGNRFNVLTDGGGERMDCENSPPPPAAESRQQHHSPIRPPT